MQQLPLLTVNEGDGGLARRRVDEARVVREQPRAGTNGQGSSGFHWRPLAPWVPGPVLGYSLTMSIIAEPCVPVSINSRQRRALVWIPIEKPAPKRILLRNQSEPLIPVFNPFGSRVYHLETV